MEGGLLSLKWNNHKPAFCNLLAALREKKSLTDAIIVCNKKFFRVHRLVLMACSDFFSEVFKQVSCQDPVVVLSGMSSAEIEALLDYMYLGEVNVPQASLPNLIKAAEILGIKGLAVPDEDLSSNKTSKRTHSCSDKDLTESDSENMSNDNSSTNNGKVIPREQTMKRLRMQDTNDPVTSNNEKELTSSPILVIKDENKDLIKEEVTNKDDNFGDFGLSQTVEFFESGSDAVPQNITNIFEAGPSGIGEASSQDATISEDICESDGPNTSYTEPVVAIQDGPQDMEYSYSVTSFRNLLLKDRSVGHVCPYCSRMFSERYKRDRHVLTHTGEKPFGCPFCPYRASRKDPVIRHIKVRHAQKNSSSF